MSETSSHTNPKRPLPRRILSVFGWGLFVVALVLIWPAALGGKTSYVVVTGKSMEPTLHAGDFVVLRSGEYDVGDVVSYEPFEDIPAQVIHRIIDTKTDGTLILQGDNNSFIDPYFPTAQEVTGKLLFSVPKIGAVTWMLGNPLVWGSLLLIAGALFLYEGKPKKPKTEGAGQITKEEGTPDGTAAPSVGKTPDGDRALEEDMTLGGGGSPESGRAPESEGPPNDDETPE